MFFVTMIRGSLLSTICGKKGGANDLTFLCASVSRARPSIYLERSARNRVRKAQNRGTELNEIRILSCLCLSVVSERKRDSVREKGKTNPRVRYPVSFCSLCFVCTVVGMTGDEEHGFFCATHVYRRDI